MDPPLRQHNVLTLSAAQAAISACMSYANYIGVPMNISVYTADLHLLAFARMTGAKLTSIDIAHNKAFTAAGHRLPTDAYTADKVGPGAPMYGVNHSNGGRFTTIAGGVPIIVDGACVGSVGCSTGTPGQDKEVAERGVQAIMRLIGQSNREKAREAKAKL